MTHTHLGFTFLSIPKWRFQIYGTKSLCHMNNSVFVNFTDCRILERQYCLEFEPVTEMATVCLCVLSKHSNISLDLWAAFHILLEGSFFFLIPLQLRMTWDIFCHHYRFYKGNFSFLCVYSPANGNSIQTNPLSLPTPMYWWEREREDSGIFAFHLQHLSRLAPHCLCLTRWIGHALSWYTHELLTFL